MGRTICFDHQSLTPSRRLTFAKTPASVFCTVIAEPQVVFQNREDRIT